MFVIIKRVWEKLLLKGIILWSFCDQIETVRVGSVKCQLYDSILQCYLSQLTYMLVQLLQ